MVICDTDIHYLLTKSYLISLKDYLNGLRYKSAVHGDLWEALQKVFVQTTTLTKGICSDL